MPEPDVAKMKVADLKRELKLRGLSTTGNKNELQDRLQNALIDGELSLEDTAISGEDLLDGDDDAVLTDEEEAKILGADENELLNSPTTTPTTVADLSLDNTKDVEEQTTSAITKKIVLKRKSSFTTIVSSSTTAAVTNSGDPATTTKENTEPSLIKVATVGGHNAITLTNTLDRKDKAVTKVSQLSMQERLEMRAKKFGINTNATEAINKINRTDNKVVDSKATVNNEQEIEMLKKRAERFGCVVSPKIAKLDVEEKLLKRKQRFGGTSNADSGKSAATNDVWAEKARQRLERFKTSTPTEKITIAEK